MFVYPEIDPIALSLGPFAIHWYGLMYLFGIAGGWWLLQRRAAAAGWTTRQVDDIVFWSAVGVIAGGRIGYLLVYTQGAWLQDPLILVRVWEGGMSFHGGLAGVLLAMWLYGRSVGRTFLQMTDFIAPVVPIGLGLGRIGNFINGELWGAPTDLPWAVVVDGVPRHASQLYQAGLEGVVMFTVLWIYSARPRALGAISGWFAVMYGTFRVAVEFVRMPDANIGYLAFGWLTMGQLLSFPLILIGAWLVVRARRTAR